MEQLGYHIPVIKNPFLNLINNNILPSNSVLDVGCGTGLVSNLLALSNPTVRITGIDFSSSADYAARFAMSNRIANASFLKDDFLTHQFGDERYDVVIAQGVLHHMPDYLAALEKIKNLVADNGKIILGLYHPLGKILKKFLTLDYQSLILEKDQELNPYELSFTATQVCRMMREYKVCATYPKNSTVNLITSMVRHSKNGGLVTYVFQKI